MFGRFAWLSTVIVAALSPALAWAQAYDPQMPAPYSMPGYGAPPQGMAGDGAHTYGRTRYTQLPDDNGWLYGDSYFDRFLKETFRHAYFRLEYLNWDFSDPGSVVLGGPIRNEADVNNPLQDPRVPFDVFDPVTGDLLGQGVSPTLDSIKGLHNNGIRGTWGFKFEPFALEASVFGLQTAKGTVVPGGLPIIQQTDANGNVTNVGTFIAQGLLVSGVPTQDALLIYDQSYKASIQTGIWGADSKVLLASVDPGSQLQVQPLFGVRFLNFNERLDQSGYFLTPDLVTGTTAVRRRIDSATQNYLYGPQFGARFELPSRWVTVGAQPSMMFGVNSYRSSLKTQQLTSANEGPLEERIVKTTFGPVFDLQVYSHGHLTENFSLFVAYNLMWAGSITRPGDNIVYNAAASGSPSDFRTNIQFSDLLIQGVSVGGEVRW